MVSLVILSHSRQIAEGILELAKEMGKDANIRAVGGTSAGTLGADFDAALEVLRLAAEEGEVIALSDIGSTWMTAQMAVEALEPRLRERVYLSSAALVEGAIAAAATISAGFSAREILEQLEPLKLPK